MNLITPTQAADRLQTNVNVINRWIQQGYIPYRQTENEGYLLEEEQFDRLCSEIREWIGENEVGEDGVIQVSVQELEQFWRERENHDQHSGADYLSKQHPERFR